ncbi:hypothetical protein HU200_044044 [Digitaria exilis]|uniref:Uncharacterized protein n=1 Tax=Digitaria exilis TaxID=1010633 RepID=A0A835B351_9POAL|nr:hypothetical protein HU200_044044 [Digitaria exilis]
MCTQAVDLEAVRLYLPDRRMVAASWMHTRQLESKQAKKKRRSPGSLIDLLKEDAPNLNFELSMCAKK